MPDLYQIKESPITDTPLVLFDCQLASGAVERWSTHQVTFEDNVYAARVVRYGNFEFAIPGDDDGGGSRLSLTLANADSHFSQIERSIGFKGSRLSARFVFFDLITGTPVSQSVTLFRGHGGSPTEITESTVRLTFQSLLSFQRAQLPQLRIQRRCPWAFPATANDRAEAADGGVRGVYSPLYACGYSAGIVGGRGNLDGGEPFTTCRHVRADCEARGMYREDAGANVTARFGGMEGLPGSIAQAVVSIGETAPGDNVPIVYGTAWVRPPAVLRRNQGNGEVHHFALSCGTISDVIKVVADQIELPQADSTHVPDATGWYRVLGRGTRNGNFSSLLSDDGAATPYGSVAVLEVVLPQSGRSERSPRVEVLLRGLELPRYTETGALLDVFHTANPAWVLLDVLRRTGWAVGDIDLASFARAAQYCDAPLATKNLNGNDVFIPRYRCNLALTKKTSVPEILRGLRNSCGFYLSYAADGRLELRVEESLATQQPLKPAGSNSETALGGGWAAYEFGDGAYGLSGIVRRANGEPSIRLSAKTAPELANRLHVSFSDEFNLYQWDSLSVVDVDDARLTNGELGANVPAIGIANYSHAGRVLTRALRRSLRGNFFVEFDTSVIGIGLRPGDIITITYLKEGLDRAAFRIVRMTLDLNGRTIHIAAQAHQDAWYSADDEGYTAGYLQPRHGLGVPRPLAGVEFDGNGGTRFGITEGAETYSDGTGVVTLSAAFVTPRRPGLPSARVPVLSLSTDILTSGTLSGPNSLYYAISGSDAGAEGPLSFVVRADLPSGASHSVRLSDLSFAPGATSFHVYRGPSPQELLRIASDVGIATSFTDTGFPQQPITPPDEFFDHANFYWRMELHPPIALVSAAANSVSVASAAWTVNEYKGQRIRILSGRGAGQERSIDGNTASQLTTSPAWSETPDNSSQIVIAEGSWKPAATVWASPAEFEIPNRRDAVVHVTGRSANASNVESPERLAPVTRWQIGGAGGSGGDLGVPGAPLFGVTWMGNGTVELSGVGFESLTNTSSVESGTVVLHYYDELAGIPSHQLTVAMNSSVEFIELSPVGSASVGTFVQVDGEIVEVVEILDGGARYRVVRGRLGTVAAAHSIGARVFHLARHTAVVSFPRNFFGSPASGAYSHAIWLPNVKLGAAQMLVTNQNGSSATRAVALTGTTDYGIRTLSGGQFTIQAEGYLAIQDRAAPPLIVEQDYAVRDVFAVVQDAPIGAPVSIRLNKNGVAWLTLTIAAAANMSNVLSGTSAGPLLTGTTVTMDILSVGQTFETTPGRNLTVTIRL